MKPNKMTIKQWCHKWASYPTTDNCLCSCFTVHLDPLVNYNWILHWGKERGRAEQQFLFLQVVATSKGSQQQTWQKQETAARLFQLLPSSVASIFFFPAHLLLQNSLRETCLETQALPLFWRNHQRVGEIRKWWRGMGSLALSLNKQGWLGCGRGLGRVSSNAHSNKF